MLLAGASALAFAAATSPTRETKAQSVCADPNVVVDDDSAVACEIDDGTNGVAVGSVASITLQDTTVNDLFGGLLLDGSGTPIVLGTGITVAASADDDFPVTVQGMVTSGGNIGVVGTNDLASLTVEDGANLNLGHDLAALTVSVGQGASGVVNQSAGTLTATTLAIAGGGTVTQSGAGVIDATNTTIGAGGSLTVANQGSGAIDGAAAGQGSLTFAGSYDTDAALGGTNSLAAINVNDGVTLTLDQNASATTVSVGQGASGSLVVTSTLTGNALVNAGAVLGGTGTVTGNVNVVGGTLSPGTSIGTINTGNLTLDANSTLAVEVNAAGAADLVNVTGTVDLGGATLAVAALPGTYAVSTDYLIIANDGADAVTNTFGTTTVDLAFLSPSLTTTGGDGNDVVLTLVRNSTGLAEVAATDNQQAVANVLDQLVSTATGDLATVINALIVTSTADAQAAYASINGEVHGSAVMAVAEGLRGFGAVTERRMRARRLASSGGIDVASLVGTQLAYVGDLDALGPLTVAEMAQAEQANAATPWGAWVEGIGALGDVDGDGNARGIDYGLGGVGAGFDYQLADGSLAGLAFGYVRGEVDRDDTPDEIEFGSYQASLYGSYAAGRFHLDGLVGFGVDDYDSTRRVTVGSIDRTAEGDYDGRHFAASVAGGYEHPVRGFVVETQVSLDYLWIYRDAFAETRAGALNLAVDDESTDNLSSTLGLRISRVFESGNVTIVPELRAGWVHRWLDDQSQVTARFAGTTPTFQADGVTVPRDLARFGAGATTHVTHAVRAFVHYDGRFSPDETGHLISAGMVVTW